MPAVGSARKVGLAGILLHEVRLLGGDGQGLGS